jgi:hypothetical protein
MGYRSPLRQAVDALLADGHPRTAVQIARCLSADLHAVRRLLWSARQCDQVVRIGPQNTDCHWTLPQFAESVEVTRVARQSVKVNLPATPRLWFQV